MAVFMAALRARRRLLGLGEVSGTRLRFFFGAGCGFASGVVYD